MTKRRDGFAAAEYRIERAQRRNLPLLDLSGLQLKMLPDSIGELTELRHLNAENNQLASLPAAIGTLPNLDGINLSDNAFREFPPVLRNLRRLEQIVLAGNQLQSLPDWLGELRMLWVLVLNDNAIATLPQSLLEVKRLRFLFLHGNDALGIPSEVLGARIDAGVEEFARARDILQYYFSKQIEAHDLRPLNEVKLLIVGRGESGKSSIVRTMVLKQKFNPNEKETPGIAIAPWKVRCGGDKVTIHVWDFAGQEIAHETHRFFLTERSLYLVVLDGRRWTPIVGQ